MSTLHRTLSLAAMAVVFMVSVAEAATTACPEDFLGGQAPNELNQGYLNKARELCFSEYAVLHSGLTRTPLWSAEHLTRERIAKAIHQRREDAQDTFHEETRLPADERATLDDYARSGYDRGHNSPNKDFDNAMAQGESFSLANMMPQNPDNNSNLWAAIEMATRQLALNDGDIYVVTIPIFNGARTLFLKNRVAVPVKIAKAVYDVNTGRGAAYLVNNAPGWEWQSISIAELRQMTAIDPFPAMNEAMKAPQNKLTLIEPKPHHSHKKNWNWRQ